MAKRIIFIAVWTGVFLLGSAFLVGLGSALIYGRQFSSDVQSDRDLSLRIGMLFAWITPICGLMGLLLGILGKLPGTGKPSGSADK